MLRKCSDDIECLCGDNEILIYTRIGAFACCCSCYCYICSFTFIYLHDERTIFDLIHDIPAAQLIRMPCIHAHVHCTHYTVHSTCTHSNMHRKFVYKYNTSTCMSLKFSSSHCINASAIHFISMICLCVAHMPE